MADAQVALAEMMLNGRGGPVSTAPALDLFEKAAAKGHAGAMFALGALYAGGHGMPMDRQLAQQWFRAAAELGHGHAQMMLGRYLASGAAGDYDDEEARLWLERAVAQGIADAEPDLAATTNRRCRGCVPHSARVPVSTTLPTMLTVLTQTPPFVFG
jgi:TPR repeat protein